MGHHITEKNMNKKNIIAMIGFLLIFPLSLFFLFDYQKQKRVDQAVDIYQEFIDGKRTANGWDIVELSMPKGELERRDETKYTMVDVNGDRIPELHIYGTRNQYVIFSVENGQMYQFGYFNSYMCKYYPLENGAFLFKADDRHDYGVYYKYFELDGSGEPKNEVQFSWISRDNDYWGYQEHDIYDFDGQKCTYEEWHALTRKYLRTTVGSDEVRNAVEWTQYCTFKD